MLFNLKSVAVEPSVDFEQKLNRFRSVDSDSLLSLYGDIERSYKDILKALDIASSTQSFYFSADAGNCAKTMAEIRSVLFSRGIRQFSTK
jgi:hypothetical protein